MWITIFKLDITRVTRANCMPSLQLRSGLRTRVATHLQERPEPGGIPKACPEIFMFPSYGFVAVGHR